mgnify:FL=1
MTKNNKVLGAKKYLALAIPLIMAAQAQGVEFNVGAIEGSFDSQLSLGSSWRVEGQDASLLTNTSGESSNSDDSNNNYNNGDAFSQIFKGNHDLQFKYQNFGGFVRGKYWYDSALANNSVRYGHNPTSTVGATSGSDLNYSDADQKLDDSNFNDLSKASGVALLDAFIYGEFDVMDMPIDVRLGKQVVSWGESTFIQGGINAINPIDVNAFRRPGSELKEALLPVNMAYANLGLSENLSAETFYQLQFSEHVIPGCGTYFSSNDYAAEGCNNVTVKDGLLSVARADDGNRLASDDGQYGVAFRYLSEALGDTEFGLYAMNIHNRAPTINGIKNNVDEVAIAQQFVVDSVTAVATQGQINIQTAIATGVYAAVSQERTDAEAALQVQMANTQAAATAAAPTVGAAAVVNNSRYYVSYEEDMQLMGLSFATNVGSVALSGEVTHKLDVPIQINGPTLITAMLGANLANDKVTGEALQAANVAFQADQANPVLQANLATANANYVAAQADNNEMDLIALNADEGSEIDGFRLFDVSQVQVTAIQFFDQVAGANRITVIGEAGMSFVHSFDESQDALKFGRSDIFGHPNATANDGFVTESSYGYRTRVVADYTDVFAGINLTPTLSWSEDLKGYAPQPGGAFQEGQQTLGLSVEASYLSMYSAALSYTQYMGGKYSTVSDRDFASISVGVQF